MALDKNAVREGTRWDLCGRLVQVDEVTGKSVIFSDVHGHKSEVMKLEGFLARASDPVRAEHSRLLNGLRYANQEGPTTTPLGGILALLRDAAIYQLERTYPGATPYVEPVAPAPAPKPIIEDVAPEPLTEADYAVAVPMPEVASPIEDEPRELKPRRRTF